MPAVTIAQAALALGVSPDTVRRRVQRGVLQPSHDAKGHLLVDLTGIASIGALPASAAAAEIAHLQTQNESLRLELGIRREEAQQALQALTEMRRLVSQSQMLQAHLAGISLGEGEGGAVVAVRRPSFLTRIFRPR